MSAADQVDALVLSVARAALLVASRRHLLAAQRAALAGMPWDELAHSTESSVRALRSLTDAAGEP